MGKPRKTRRPFLLAQVALKAYAVLLALVAILLTPMLATPSLSNAIFFALLLGAMAGLFLTAEGLSKARAWARIVAYLIFIGFAALTLPILKTSLAEKELPEFIWPQIWTLIMLGIGIMSLLLQKPRKTEDPA